MRGGRAAINMQMLDLPPLEWTARYHAFDGLFQHALRMARFKALTNRPAFYATRKPSVVVKYRLVELVACNLDPGSIDDHDVVTTVDMRGELRLVLAAQMVCDDH